MIRGAVREAGDRAKVAVYSRERDVDPVGACVGMKGTRVQAIIRELRGEKIDIVEWSEDPVLFVTNALSPAKVQRVSIVDDHERVMEVVVEDKQLSLAIGKKGQNVRLGGQADRLAHRHQERGREAARGRSAVRRPRAGRRLGRCSRRSRPLGGRRFGRSAEADGASSRRAAGDDVGEQKAVAGLGAGEPAVAAAERPRTTRLRHLPPRASTAPSRNARQATQ